MKEPAPAASIFSKSRWIWPESHNWDLHNAYALFRKELELTTLPRKAPLFITADQSYQLYVNGRYICRGPARGFQSHWPYDEVDVRPHLRKGRNVIAVRAHNPGFSNFQYLTQGYAGLLVAAKWGKVELLSDNTWKGRRQSGIHRDTVPTSLQLFCQEHIDLRIEDPQWMQPDFDDTDWTAMMVEHPWNGMPWSSLEERGIPLLEEKETLPLRCLGTAEGLCASDYLVTRDIARSRYAEGLAHRKEDLPVETFEIPATGRKHFRSYLIDFGRTVIGSVGFEILGAKGGEIVDTLHIETIDQKTLTPHFLPDRHCRMAFGHRLTCRAGDQTHTFYHSFGFRYMVLTVRDSETALRIRPLFRTTLYPLEQHGLFSSSDTTLERIWETCAWTQRVCSLDAYVDTPWREQAQWWGDARVQAWNTFHLSGDSRLFRRGIAQIAAQTTPNGLTYGHAPTMAHSCILPDFSLIWILTLWDYYWQTGSTEPLHEHEKTVEGILEFFRKAIHPKTGLVQYDPRYWLFLDWTDIQKEGCPALLSLWLLIVLEKLADLYAVRRNRTRSAELRAWAARLRVSLLKLVDDNGLVHDGFDAKGKLVTETSIHSQTLAIFAELYPSSQQQMLDRVIVPFIRGAATGKAQPSAYWVTYVFTLLQQRGYGPEVVEYIRKEWSPMAEHGTTWENFSPRLADESFSHAWSAHPLYHLMQIIGGVTQTAPAWKRIAYEPCFVGDSADVVIPTPQGVIRSAWSRSGSRIKVKLSLPKGTVATVKLAGVKPTKVEGISHWMVKA